MSKQAKRVSVSLLVGLVAPAFSWLVGYDFDVRGDRAVGTFLLYLIVVVVTFNFPGWDDL